ncbi:polymorphic toxin type 23 domain-containing protein [Rubrivirga marina]|uniref:Bacterial toxin 23 domain-containing protein n=1 Tax=Rubrivirga marina TaxID=1196024 RepID=A0A271J527_9BACT|nr:polymorphic toxin type 23 domain-containing protein [Rubrivirga marina]PAP78377.1 hypothetical protein BSZ37_19090 [Rubrivirga marina]
MAATVAAQGHALVLDRPASVGAAVTSKVGTHESGVGVAAGGSAPLPLGLERAHDVSAQASLGAEALVADLGLPGSSVGAEAALGLSYGFGPRRAYRGAELHRARPRAHTLSYTLLLYLDTDHTSQLSGAVRYRFAGEASSFDVTFENDALAQQLLDRYRTFALRVRYVRHDADVLRGVGLRTVVWIGTTEGLGRLNRDETYDLSGQYGGAYAHGILAADLYWGDLTLSLGVDSEGIRSTLQNSFHYLIDDGQIPRLAGRRPRLVVRVALNEGDGLY